MSSRSFPSALALAALSLSLLPAAAQNVAPADCSRFQVNLENEWSEFSSLLQESNIPAELWAELNDIAQPISIEDYGITSNELNAFFQGNAEAISKMTDNNPLRPYIDRALAIMGGYGLGYGDIQPLLDVRSDIGALMAALAERGLDAARADAFLAEIAPVVAEAADSGALRYGLVQQADDFMSQVNGTLSPAYLRQYIDNLDGLRQELLADGEDPTAVEQMVSRLQALREQGLSDKMLRNYQIEEQKEELRKYGVPEAALASLTGKDADQVAECLTQMGLDGAAIGSLTADGSLDSISPEELEAFYAEEMAEFLALSGLSLEELDSLFGLSDEEILAFLSSKYDPAYAAWLLGQLSNSAFFGLAAYEDMDDYTALALALASEIDPEARAALVAEFAFVQALTALDELDEEAFAALFNDPAALDAWFATFEDAFMSAFADEITNGLNLGGGAEAEDGAAQEEDDAADDADDEPMEEEAPAEEEAPSDDGGNDDGGEDDGGEGDDEGNLSYSLS